MTHPVIAARRARIRAGRIWKAENAACPDVRANAIIDLIETAPTDHDRRIWCEWGDAILDSIGETG